MKSAVLRKVQLREGDTVNSVSEREKSPRPRGNKSDHNNRVSETNKRCGNCGRIHDPDNCIARGKTCGNCGRLNHIAAVCRSGKRRSSKMSQSVKVLDEEIDSGEDSDEIYVVSDVAAVTLDDAQLVTLRLAFGNYLRFQPDTGAQCNVIPVHLYKKAANDSDLAQVHPAKSAISAYRGSQLLVV